MKKAKSKIARLSRVKPKETGQVKALGAARPNKVTPKVDPRIKVLTSWTKRLLEIYRALKSPEELSLYCQLQHRLDVVQGQEMQLWFKSLSSRLNVSTELICAALVTGDLTKFKPLETQEATHRSQLNDLLPYGAVFKTYGKLECLYMHSAAAEFFALTKFKAHCQREGMRPQEATVLCQELRDTIRGHDSYGYGFDGNILLSTLSEKYSREFTYPASLTLNGFILQLIDKLQPGSQPAIDNQSTAYANLLADARSKLTSAQFRVLLSCPALTQIKENAAAVSA